VVRDIRRSVQQLALGGATALALLAPLAGPFTRHAFADTLASVDAASPVATQPVIETGSDVSTIDALERALLERTNADRTSRGLQALSFDPALLNIARTRAAAQVTLPALSHVDASGELAVGRLLASEGVKFDLAGENLARLTGADATTAERAEVALMNSPTHRKNILESRFTSAAIGAVVDANGKVVYAQIFR
jgi:uncharacterized protein YkwD